MSDYLFMVCWEGLETHLRVIANPWVVDWDNLKVGYFQQTGSYILNSAWAT